MHTGILLPVSPVDPLSRNLYILKSTREGPDGKPWTISLFRFICEVGQDCRLRLWGERACAASNQSSIGDASIKEAVYWLDS